MIKPPSLVSDYSLIYSGDPALNLPADATEAVAALERARETSQWQALIREGETPTLFHVRPLHGTLWDWFVGEINRRQMVEKEYVVFALRLALTRIENFGPHKVSHTKIDGHRMATTEIIDALYGVEGGREVVEEIGLLVFARGQQALSKK